MALAIVTRIPNLAEAQIAAGALRSAGIEAQVFDGAFGTIEAPVIEALGGFRIMAPESQAAEAREILKAIRGTPGLGEPEDNAPWTASLRELASRRSGGLRTAVAILAALAVAVLVLRIAYR